jgi:hypothetical protein
MLTKPELKATVLILQSALMALVILFSTSGAFAQEMGSETKEWRFAFIPYIWITSMNGEMTVRGRTVDIDASFGDIIDNADSIFAFNGILAARKGRWGGYVDGTYMKLGTDDSKLGPLTVDTTNQLAYFEFGGLYRLGEGVWGADWQEDKPAKGRRWFLDFIAGGRMTTQDNQFTLKGVQGSSRQISQSRTWTDPIFGFIGITDLSESRKWEFRLKGDIGGFGVASQFMWNFLATVGYNFQAGKANLAPYLGYRAFYQDFSDGSGQEAYEWDVTLHGPVLGLKIGW